MSTIVPETPGFLGRCSIQIGWARNFLPRRLPVLSQSGNYFLLYPCFLSSNETSVSAAIAFVYLRCGLLRKFLRR